MAGSPIFQESLPETGWDLKVLEFDASGRPVGPPRTFTSTPFHETSAAISFDGRRISCESDELDGLVQIYLRSFPDGANKIRVSPRVRACRPGTRAAIFITGRPPSTMWAVHPTEQSGRLGVDTPQAVWRGAYAPTLLRRIVTPLWGTGYDVDPSGARFLVLETAAIRSVLIIAPDDRARLGSGSARLILTDRPISRGRRGRAARSRAASLRRLRRAPERADTSRPARIIRRASRLALSEVPPVAPLTSTSTNRPGSLRSTDPLI